MIFIFTSLIIATFAITYFNLDLIITNPDVLSIAKVVLILALVIILPLSIRGYTLYTQKRKLKSLSLEKEDEKRSVGFDCIDCLQPIDCVDCIDIDLIDCDIIDCDMVDCDIADAIDCADCVDCGDCISGIDCG